MTKQAPREMEYKGYKAEFIGTSRSCQVWINGQLYMAGVYTFREARRLFISRVNRLAA